MTALLIIFAALLFIEIGVTWRHLEVPAIRRRRPTIDVEYREVT